MQGPLLDDLTFTPTFAVVENGWEVGRIRGYPGDDFFWGLLGQILARLAPGEVVSGQAATR